jgi:hypothetical protein
MSTSIIGASVSVRAKAAAHDAKVVMPVRRLGEDRRKRKLWLASPAPAQSVVT